MTTEAKLTVGQALAATKFLIVATDINNGETVFCQQPSRLRRYRFAPTYTLKGALSERRITREEATEFTYAEAQEVLASIDHNLRTAMGRWIDNWRIIPVQDADRAAFYRAELAKAAPPANGSWYQPGEDGYRLCAALRLAEGGAQ